ncbi:PelD GGDEF domain-containing protein [Gallaecimonas pentaromativorans]|uniref:PelD GGDEF domain-containing protein n=1 Tax=Gallaecimonas pentaromativorans TaxID=584787 RepID=UPI003A8DB5B1
MKPSLRKARQVPESQAWLEVLVFTALALAIPAWLRPSDPFWQHGDFAWPMLGPLLVALRYGFAKGLASVLLLVAGQLLLRRVDALVTAQDYPFGTMVGYALVAMVAGEFRDLWERTNEQQKLQLDYVRDRLDTFTRHYHLLRSSHDRLEQMLAGHALSLRESLQAVRSAIGQLQERRLDKAARAILGLFVEYGGLQSVSLYAVEDGDIIGEPLARVGQTQPANGKDPMVLAMFEQRELISVAQLQSRAEQSQYQIVIPLIDVNDRVYGVLLVEQIQFFTLREATLTLMAVMAGHVGDLLRHALANPVMGPDEKPYFHAQVLRAQREAKRYAIPAQLMKIRATEPSTQAERVLEHLNATRRGLDVYLYDAQSLTLLLLMPLADELDQAGFIGRINSWSVERLGKSLAELNIQVEEQRSLPVDEEAINHFMELGR